MRADVESLAGRLRPADLLELAALNSEPRAALEAGLSESAACCAVRQDGRTVAMFGCVVVSSAIRYGNVWLLGSVELQRIRVRFLRESRKWLAWITEGCHLTGNMVDSRNTLHVRWIRWLGYKFLRRVKIGGVEFWEFAKIHV